MDLICQNRFPTIHEENTLKLAILNYNIISDSSSNGFKKFTKNFQSNIILKFNPFQNFQGSFIGFVKITSESFQKCTKDCRKGLQPSFAEFLDIFTGIFYASWDANST